LNIDDLQLHRQSDGMFEGWLVLPGESGGLTLRLEVGRGEPTSAQFMVVEEFVAGWLELRPRLEPALFAYYSAAALDQADAPHIATQGEVWSGIRLGSLEVPPTSPSGSRLARLAGACGWADEEGLEIGVRAGRELLYVGPYYGKGLREPPQPSPWNYADVAIQDAALLGVPVSEEEFDRVAAIMADPARVREVLASAGAPRSRRRSWWKFW
jgi:hypothetical protein